MNNVSFAQGNGLNQLYASTRANAANSAVRFGKHHPVSEHFEKIAQVYSTASTAHAGMTPGRSFCYLA